MEVIIKKSRKPDKKFDAVIDGKKTVSFGAKNIATIHYIKMMKEKLDISIVIRKMKIGIYQVLTLLDFMQNIFCGIRKVLKNL